ncbi:2-ketoisovalerate ferredoxin oxidoreductase subunit alpha [Syntrophomonas wolfei]|uniref:Pyruvate ferredoxin oxidoreductase, alpha subunit n=1 Tax=Syntrophomonas wolfei subsp. wolfei (strain DSM 2245B / Goettingen) TaxID=335541 RepID=Q0AX72_SYNWW|nr:2-ketoisovalerate ferredoxin oxidoreductase subunit alpha [Syntrophomonas wolfei]ABI68682.1 pyruvate ferredoxin oxidoreductase, alpha subunit [Syntrophomonas wolfei subsp. wolfei str. Goettingen G311]
MSSRLSGNEAVAYAMKQINPDVMGAFPITPSTEIPEYFAAYVANGEVNTEYVAVESEHSSMSVCIAAQAAGARAVSATSSCGLALMYELLYVAASCRLPITLACVNRALSGPININHDYSDSMGARDSGWIQIYAENNQEAYDNIIMAMPIGETPNIRLPVMSCMDGFITSHAVENIELLETDVVRKFIGEYNPEHYLLKKENPLAVGPYDVSAYYMEHKVQEAEAMKAAKSRILEVAAEFEKISGRRYGLFEEYRMEDAQLALVLIGSTAGTAKAAINKLRENGIKAGLVKIRVFRPFPGEELARALAGTRAVAVMDKSEGFSANGGPLFAETRSALYDLKERPYMINIVYGLGGRDVKTEDIEKVFGRLADIARTGETHPVYTHMGQRSREEETA